MYTKIESTQSLTDKEAYEAMIYFLLYYYQLTDSNELTDVLSGSEYIVEDVPADSAFWEYWLEAIERVKNEGPPPLKRLIR